MDNLAAVAEECTTASHTGQGWRALGEACRAARFEASDSAREALISMAKTGLAFMGHSLTDREAVAAAVTSCAKALDVEQDVISDAITAIMDGRLAGR